MSNEILSFQQSRDKLNMSSLFRLCRKDEISINIVARNSNNAETTFDLVERIVRLVAFDDVAGVDGFYTHWRQSRVGAADQSDDRNRGNSAIKDLLIVADMECKDRTRTGASLSLHWQESESMGAHVNFYSVTSPHAPFLFPHRTHTVQELIRRWDSERELFNDDIAHT